MDDEPERAPRVTLVVGLGNPLRGDDGVGPRLVDELLRRQLPPWVSVVDCGSGGLDLLRLWDGWPRVVVVDAADVAQEPGRFVRFTPDEARLLTADDRFSMHNAGLAEALALARALQMPLPSIVVFGVQPQQLDWQEGLSPAVTATLPELVEAVLREVGEDNVQNFAD